MEAHHTTRHEFVDRWLGKYHTTITKRPTNFAEWAKNNGIAIPNVDYGKVFGMAIHNNKTRALKGKWHSELRKYAAVNRLYEQYKEEVPEAESLVLANRVQLALIHKRKVRLALRNNEPVSREILKDYPDITGGCEDGVSKCNAQSKKRVCVS